VARVEELEQAREAHARRRWREAHDAFAQADRLAALAAEDLERYAWTAAFLGDDEELLQLLERLYQQTLASGDGAGAASAAFWLGFRLSALGEMGRASGWLTRAERLVQKQSRECALAGYLLLPSIHRHLACGAHDAAQEAALQAVEIGERCGDPSLVAFARSLHGLVLIRQGRTQEGIALFDEAMVAVTSGELSPLVTGVVYCNVISCCQQVYALSRAREWTTALADWCQAQPELVTFTGSCMVHRSEIMQIGGAWGEALAEARRAAERCTRPADHEIAAEACYQQAEIHRLRGEQAEAEQAYRRASQLGREPQPGLSLLRLAEGRGDAAAGAIRRVLAARSQVLQRAQLLPACVEIMLAVGEMDEARSACQELEQIAAGVGSEVLGAIAAHARGALLLADGDALAAADPLRRAFQVWQQVGAPYVAARIRVLLGCAYRALADEEGALLELDAARNVFEQLGAAPDIARVDALKNESAPCTPHVLTPREIEVLRLVASGRTNKAIAKQLHLSERTVDRHVSNILTKLGAPSRAAATAYAYENRLI
jgi:DNA-binding CsgD family transcriptional regulator